MSLSEDITDDPPRDDEVFRPRASLSRTPPLNGRKRSLLPDSSSEEENMEQIRDLKKQKLRSKDEGNGNNINVTGIMESIHNACAAIEENISRESNHKITFNKKERDIVRMGVTDILKDCNMLLAVAVEALNKCTTLQREKEMRVSELKEGFHDLAKVYETQISIMKDELKKTKINPQMTISTPTTVANKPIPTKRTRYASIVALNSSDEEGKSLPNEDGGWKKVSKKVSQVVKDKMNVQETGALRNKISLKSGKVILESKTKAQNEAVRQALTGVPGIKVKELTNQDPTVVLTGIEKGYDESEIISELYAQNIRIQKFLETEQLWKQNIKYLTRRECRNPNKENWTFQVTPKLFAFLEKEGRVVLDLVEVLVEERIQVTMCYRCCAFGHVAKYCRAPAAICIECGNKGHERTNCTSSIKSCINCRRFLGKNLEHSALDALCPCMVQKRAQQRTKINYNG